MLVLPLIISFLHICNDMFSSFLAPLLPSLQGRFGVSYAAVSLVVAIYSFSSSLLQPVAGLIADRYDRRLLAALGPLLVVLGFGFLGFYPNLIVMAISLSVAGLGSALFHSSGAALAGQYAPAGKKGFWLSFFASSGMFGIAMAPMVAVGMENGVGLKGLALLTPLGAVAAFLLMRQAPPINIDAKPSSFRDLARVFRGEVAKLWAISTLRNVTFMSFSTTIPFWFAQRGISDAQMAITLSIYSFAAVAGTFIGGTLSDRVGRKRVLVMTMVGSLPIYAALMLFRPESWLYIPLLALAGALMNAGIPVAVAMAQEYEPKQIATVSGLLMGFTWGFAGLLYGIIGPLVERFGVVPTLTVLGLLLIPALVITLSLSNPALQTAASDFKTTAEPS